MRYREIIEGLTEDAQADAERRRKANERLNNARRKKTDAARAYQERMRRASEAERNAQAALRKPS